MNLKLEKLFLYCFSIMLGFIFFSSDLSKYIFQMPDDYIYSAGAHDFLTTGSYHWAGSKPGIVLLASLFGLTSPTSIMYLFLSFGLISAFALFLVAHSIFDDSIKAIIPVSLWLASPFFIYFSKTHLLICASLYLLGAWIAFSGIKSNNLFRYLVGCIVLGYSLLTYYLMALYLPFLFIFFAYMFYLNKYTVKDYILKSSFAALPILIHDGFAILAYLVLGKKNAPFLYSLWGQFMCVQNTTTTDYGFLLYPGIFYEIGGVFFSVLFIISFLLLIFLCVYKRNDKYLFLLSLIAPLFLLLVRSGLGSLSALRMYVGVIPVIYLVISFILVLASRWHVMWLLPLVLGYLSFSTFYNFNTLQRKLETGYYQTARIIESMPHKRVVYLGQRRLWEQLVDKSVIPLNIYNDPLLVINDSEKLSEFILFLDRVIDDGIIFAISHLDLKSHDHVISVLSKHYKVSLIDSVSSPHTVSRFVLEESNAVGHIDLADARERLLKNIKLYELERL